MEYSTQLPPTYRNWVSFYEAAKPYLLDGVDDLHWYVPLTSAGNSAEQPERQEYRYSVRFIEQQTLAELYAFRQLQTFTFDECRLLYNALQLATSSSPVDPGMNALKAKVELFYTELQKQSGR